MAITDYASLKTEAATWLARADQTSNIDTFIDNFEAWFNRSARVRQMVTSTTSLTISSGVITNPTDWLEWKNIRVTTVPITHVEIYTEETGDYQIEDGQTGRPLRAIVRGDTTILRPTPDSTSYAYEAVYYQKLTALSGSNTTNWLLTSHSDIYLYGTLWQACMLLQDAQTSMYWKGLTDEKMTGLFASSRRSTHGGGSLTPRVRNVV